MAYSGKWKPKNVKKYRGDPNKIHYRSNWEKFFMNHLDNSDIVESWSSEEVVIQYFSNADGRKRRYFVDFYVKYTNGDQFLIEVKPKKETLPPTKPVKLTAGAKKKFMNEIYTYSVNQDKWKAAIKYCQLNKYKFKVLTEDGLAKLGYNVVGGSK